MSGCTGAVSYNYLTVNFNIVISFVNRWPGSGPTKITNACHNLLQMGRHSTCGSASHYRFILFIYLFIYVISMCKVQL